MKIEERTRKTEKYFKNLLVEYDEKYGYDRETGEEVYIRSFADANRISLTDAYKRAKGLLTSNDIKKIRRRYDMNQKEFALALGMGEVTVHRFEKGSVQSGADDEIMRLAADPDNMHKLLLNNRDSFRPDIYEELRHVTEKEQEKKRHRLLPDNAREVLGHLSLVDTPTISIARFVAKRYNHQFDWLGFSLAPIKIEKLQLLLYHIQAASLLFYDHPAFEDRMIIKDGKLEIDHISSLASENGDVIVNDEVYLSAGLEKIVEMVLESYGRLETAVLMMMFMDEDPVIKSAGNGQIYLHDLKAYYTNIYS